MPFKWTVTPTQAWLPGMQRLETEMTRVIHAVAEKWAPVIEEWMKAEARWNDVTGEARRTLFADVEEMVGGVAIDMDYGVWYGQYLATKRAGSLDIIGPALDHFAPLVFEDVVKELSALFGQGGR